MSGLNCAWKNYECNLEKFLLTSLKVEKRSVKEQFKSRLYVYYCIFILQLTNEQTAIVFLTAGSYVFLKVECFVILIYNKKQIIPTIVI